MKTRTSASALLAVLVLVWRGFESAPLFGQSMILTTNELTNQADVVAVGKVAAMKPEWNADKTRIFTRVTVSVTQFLKGGGEPLMSILTPGGEIGEDGEIYFGTAQFKDEEDVVVFAKRGPNREFRIAGGAQGKTTITRDKATGALMVGPAIKLDELVANVKTALQAPRPEEK